MLTFPDLCSFVGGKCHRCGYVVPEEFNPSRFRRACDRAPSPAATTPHRRGPGAILAEILNAIGLHERSGCSCRALAGKMDAWGIDGCRANRPEIIGKLKEAEKKVPFRERLKAFRAAVSRGIYVNPLRSADSLLDLALWRAARPRDLVFNFPPGIGDSSWTYAKIADLAERRNVEVRVCESQLPRGLDFVQLLPFIDTLGWGPPFNDEIEFVDFDTDLEALPPGEYNIFANPHLEAGGRLDAAWPKQQTRYHYAINTSPAMRERAGQILRTAGRPLIGFYCSSGTRADKWQNIWGPQDWMELLKGVAALIPGATFVAIGALYDKRTPAVAKLLRAEGHQVLECVGPHIGVTIEVMKRLDYFLAYPSGLGILGDVIDTPTLMFYWPNHHDPFVNTYADPVNVANGRHLNQLFGTVPEALSLFQERGLPWIKQAAQI